MGSRFEFWMDRLVDDDLLMDHKWHRVSGGGLPWPVLIRLGETAEGRPIVTGMIIDPDASAEITSDGLRKVPIGAILAQLFENFDPAKPPPDAGQLDHEPDHTAIRLDAVTRRVLNGDPVPEKEIDDALRYFAESPAQARIEWELMYDATSGGAVVPAERATPTRGPSDDDLRRIAAIYQQEIKRHPRRAMTTTAERFPTTRQTANRWVRICRERGYLPQK